MAKQYDYELLFKVRDYECDLQGIVNNANYQHYLEHTRHEFLLSQNISFAFYQDIYRLPDMKLCIRAKVESVCLVNGALNDCPQLDDKLAPFFRIEK